MNDRGISIVESLITLSIMSIVSVAMAKTIAGQYQTISYMEDKITQINLQKEMSQLLSHIPSCEKTLVGTFVSQTGSSAIAAIFDEQGGVHLQSHTTINELQVGQISLRPSANASHLYDIEIPTQRVRVGGGPSLQSIIDIKVSLSFDSSGKVTSCQAPQGLSAQPLDCIFNGAPIKSGVTVAGLGGANSQVYYNGKMVVIDPSNLQHSGTPLYTCVNGDWIYVSSIDSVHLGP